MSNLTIGKIEQLTNKTNNLDGSYIPNKNSFIDVINEIKLENQQLKEQLKNFENIKLTKVNNIEKATHWIPRYDENIYSQIENADIRLNNPYKIYIDEKDLDYFIYDDNGVHSTTWLDHDGDLVILKV